MGQYCSNLSSAFPIRGKTRLWRGRDVKQRPDLRQCASARLLRSRDSSRVSACKEGCNGRLSLRKLRNACPGRARPFRGRGKRRSAARRGLHASGASRSFRPFGPCTAVDIRAIASAIALAKSRAGGGPVLSLGLRPNPELAPASSSTGSDESLLISSWRRGSLGPRSVISSWQGVSFNRQSVVSSWQFVSFRRQSVVSSWQRLSFNRRSVVSSWQRLSFNRRSVVSSWQRLSFNRQSVVSSWQRVSFRRQSVVSYWQRGSFNRRSVVSSWQRGSFRRQSVVSYWQRLSFNRRSVVSYWQRGSFNRQSVVSSWQRGSFNRRSVVSSWQSVWFGWARVFAHCRSDFSNCRSDGSNWQSVASRRRSVPASSMRRLRDRKVDVSSESRGASVGGAAVPLLLNRGARDFVAWEGDICGGRSAR